MKTRIVSADLADAIPHALDVLNAGGLVAFPTDTVYGLGARAFDAKAVESIYRAKGRAPDKAIPVLIGSAEDIDGVASEVPDVARQLAARFWPGPLTLVVPKKPMLPEAVSATETVGVRMPDHQVALALLAAAGPMAVTSANMSGRKSTTTAQQVYAQLHGRVALILDGGRAPGGVPSTVVDCTAPGPVILRAGPLSLEQLKSAWA